MSAKTTHFPAVLIGGGVAGLSAAIDLANRGVPSLLIERGPVLGGRAREFCCKAVESCARCGACRVADLLREAAARPEITIWTSARPVGAKAKAGGWRLTVEPGQGNGGQLDMVGRPLTERSVVEAGAVILAVGATPFDPSAKTRFGYGRVPGVISALELEQALSGDLAELCGGEAPSRVAFIQCVGSRDQSLGNLYCSRVCCGFALRMARVIRGRLPECAVTFYHMDVQRYGRAWEEDLAAMRADMDFVRAMPGEVRAGDSGPEVAYNLGQQTQKAEFDLVVLSQGLRPPVGAAALSELFGAERTADGFLGSQDDPVAAGADGVFVAGSARGPRSIVESIEHGALAASAAAAWLRPEAGEAAHG